MLQTSMSATDPDAAADDLLACARSELDWDSLRAIRAELPKKHEHYLTYLDAATWFRKLWREAVRLRLHRMPSQRVLDLGTGPGHFAYICRYLGHKVLGLERPGACLDAFHEWMGLEVVSHAIAANRPLPRLPVRFDTVTAFRVPFNKKRETGDKSRRQLFDLDEWSFFLDDVRDHVLRPGGRLVLKMNSQPNHAGLHYGDPTLMDFLARRGAAPEQRRLYVTFDPLR
jgi:SAM-dependent methyltransferase